MKLDFKARIVAAGPKGAWCFIHFPYDIVKTFGTRARVPVRGTINGFPFRNSFSAMGGQHVMSVNKELQAGGKVKPGETAHFIMERDDKPRTVTVPAVLKKALAQEPAAKAIFDKFAYSHRKEYVDWINSAKQPETVQRRLEKLIPMVLKKQRLK